MSKPKTTTETEFALLNATEVARRLGYSASRFYYFRDRGAFDFLKTQRPIGTRIYSRALVEQYVQGESTVKFGRGARAAS